MRQRAGISLFLLVVCGTLLISSWLARQVSAVSRDAYTNIEEFANVLTMVQKNYVDEVGTDKLIDGAINGMPCAAPSATVAASASRQRESRIGRRRMGGRGWEGYVTRDDTLPVGSGEVFPCAAVRFGAR